MDYVDWSRMIELKTDIGEEAFADVAFLFVAEISEHLDRLMGAPDTMSGADFHFLRGSAANLGFAAMAVACSEAEGACRAGQPPDLDRVIAAFHAALDEARKRLPELTAA